MQKKYIGFLGILLLIISCNPTSQKKEKSNQYPGDVMAAPSTDQEINDLAEVITRFARAFIAQDNQKANALIHPEEGIYIIYRAGAMDTFEKVDTIDFLKPVPEYSLYPDITNDYALTFESLPTFDCGQEHWDKMGFFCDTTSHPKQLSNIIAFEAEFTDDKLPEDVLLKMEQDEFESYRIIITINEPLIFHVRKIKDKWYVTTLDRAYAGCDA